MFTKLFTSLHRFAGFVTVVVLVPAALIGPALAQVPVVISASPVAVPHNEVYGAPWQAAVTNSGDFALFDFKTSGLYQYPVSGAAEITVAAPNAIAGGFTDSGIAIDPRNNNLYLNNNYNGGLLEFPFDPATNTWDLPSVVVASGLAGNLGGGCGNYFQSAGLAINSKGVMAVATENGCGVEIFTVSIDASGNFGAATPIVANMKARAKTVAIDDAGNIFYTEDNGNAGVLYIPVGTTGLNGEATGVYRIDPSLGAVQGVTTDPAGNAYIVDGSAGAYLVPFQSGSPNTAAAIQLSTIAANGGPSIDAARGVLFYPTSGSGSIKDLVKLYLGRQEFGPTTVAAATPATAAVNYLFDTSATPYSFAIAQTGVSGVFTLGSLSGCGITFTTTTNPNGTTSTMENATTYAPNATCSVPVTFTPTNAGDVSASLLMLDRVGNVLNTTVLHGSTTGSAILGIPGTESLAGAGFKTPTQVAADLAGNIYVADSGLGKVLLFARGATVSSTSTSLGTGLVAPTGVAVDGTGNVYIADSGKLLEIPYGVNGLNVAGQMTLKTGLGKNLRLAVDALGDLYSIDPDNKRLIRLRNLVSMTAETDTGGFTQPSAITSDGAGNVYVADGSNLIQFSSAGRKTLLTSIPNTTGLAVDLSGAVYVTSTTQTIRIPNESGTLNPAHLVKLGPGVAQPSSVAVDVAGNIYVLDAAAGDVDVIKASASLNLGTLGSTTATTTGTATLFNSGNAPLTITGFSTTADYSVTSTTCVGSAIAVGASCSATVTFSAGPGDQGTLTGLLLANGNTTNPPVGINVIGVGAPLAASKTTINVTNPTVTNAPVIVTVASNSGTGPTPTGNVTITVSGTGVTPIVTTQPLVNGTLTFNETTIPAGSLTFTASYIGDRVYGKSNASTTVTVGKGTLVLAQPPAASVPVYVLAGGAGAQEPYDGTQIPFYYNYPVTVKAANGAPLLGVPIVNAGGTQTGTDFGTVTYQLASGTPACSGSASTINVAFDGTAAFPTSCLGIDTSNNQIPNLITSYTITPVYSGNTDPNYATVTGTPVTFIAIRNPMVIIKANPGSLTVAAGSSVSANITLTSLLGYGVAGANGNLNNYTLPLEMGCSALPAHTTCSFTYPVPDPSDASSVAVTPTTPGAVVMTLNTNVPVGTTSASLHRGQEIFAAFCGLGLLGLAFSRRRRSNFSLLSVAVLTLCSTAMIGLSACSSANISSTPVLTTPKGTYTITVTAKQAGSKTVPNPVVGGAPITVYGNGNQMSIPFTMSVTVQ